MGRNTRVHINKLLEFAAPVDDAVVWSKDGFKQFGDRPGYYVL